MRRYEYTQCEVEHLDDMGAEGWRVVPGIFERVEMPGEYETKLLLLMEREVATF